ncbi:hypothetical protein FQN54_004048 [Arachnomyces sp. PD_36]|nr:hypothetical protein FQN54_004048 [Arachnomyces sp. PD_36]
MWANTNLVPEGVRVFTDFGNMISDPDLAAVIIDSPSPMCAKHSMAAVRHGIHVLCGTANILDLASLEALMQAVHSDPSTAKAMVGCIRRFDSRSLTALKWIQDREIGVPTVIHSRVTEKVGITASATGGESQANNMVLDTIVPDLDLTLSFLGEDVKPRAVWATGWAHHKLDELGYRDDMVGVVEFWDKTIVYYHHSRNMVDDFNYCMKIMGTAGEISICLNKNEVPDSVLASLDRPSRWIDCCRGAIIAQIDQFVEAILDDKKLPLRLESAHVALNISLALQQSIATGKNINFDINGRRIPLLPNS